MPELPFTGLLDRAEAKALVDEHFRPQLELLEQLVNYGTNLVVRAYNSSAHSLGDVVVCGVLLKQVVAMLDGVAVSVASGSVHSAFLPARAAFEASLFVDWMLFSDLEKKATYYYVANLRAERNWALRAIEGTCENLRFSRALEQIGQDIASLRPEIEVEARSLLEEVNLILNQDALYEACSAFDKAKGRRVSDSAWYSLLGKKSIRELADTLHRLPEYELFYSKGSSVTHAASYKDHIGFSGGDVRFKQLRSLEGLTALINFTVSLALKTYDSVLRYYRHDELPRLWRQYLNDWRGPFLSIKDVTYK